MTPIMIELGWHGIIITLPCVTSAPCPECGHAPGRNALRIRFDGDTSAYVQCRDCRYQGSIDA